jgi:hypothetical protein
MKCLGCCLGENLEEEKLVGRIFKRDQISNLQKNEPTHYASHVFWDDLKINRKTEKSFIG